MELQKVNISESYTYDKYPSKGFYHNEYDDCVYYVSDVNKWVVQLEHIDYFKSNYNTVLQQANEPTNKDGVVSESFALKMLAINNGTKVEDLRL